MRQELTGGLTETLIDHAHQIELTRQGLICATCDRLLAARPAVSRTVDTMVGSVQLERPYFYCRHCQQATSPLDDALDLTPGRKQLDVQQAAARVGVDTPYDEAQTLFRDLTGVRIDLGGRVSGGRPRGSAFICSLAIASCSYSVGTRCKARRKWARP